MSCPICLVENVNHITICNHSFCENCINRWLETKITCPLCRHTLREKTEAELQEEQLQYELENEETWVMRSWNMREQDAIHNHIGRIREGHYIRYRFIHI